MTPCLPAGVAPPGLPGLILRAVVLGLAACALPARGQPLNSTAPTANWYADHPRERAAVVEICNQNPGPARTNDNCAAAWQGNIIAAEREARRNQGDRTPPSSPDYWRRRPEERAQHLATCNRVDPDVAARIWCGPARQAEGEPPRSPRGQSRRM